MNIIKKRKPLVIILLSIFLTISCTKVENNNRHISGNEDVIVFLHGNTVQEIADQLANKKVITSTDGFIESLKGKPIQLGYYKLKVHMSNQDAINMILDKNMESRVGRLVIPEGSTLSSKIRSDNKIIPGIFNRLADASLVELNGKKSQHQENDFLEAAKNLSFKDLNIPKWAKEPFDILENDFRKIEGLIRPGAWEDVNPLESPRNILKFMIENTLNELSNIDGLVSNSKINLTPYEKLILASIVEQEVLAEQYYPKVSRVILNRIKWGHRLEMDSTINYYSNVPNINLYESDLLEENEWNTYSKYGLPITPIGAANKDIIKASLNPASGKWLFFVTINDDGKTLFADDLEGHEKNILIGCKNNFLTAGC